MSDFSQLSDADLLAAYKATDPFEQALKAEGVNGKAADFVRSIYQQESSGGKNTKTSNAGAVGGMQIIPSTFASVADKGWDINDPVHNTRAGIRYALQGLDAAGGDPALAGAYYYGGPGGLAKARQGVAVSDPRNPNAPTTLQYGQQVAARLPKDKGLVQRAVEAVIPSAQAETMPTNSFQGMSDADLLAAYQKLQGGSAEPAQPDYGNTPRVEVRGTSADEPPPPGPSVADRIGGGIKDLTGGLVRGAGSIGATIMAPVDAAARGLGVDPNSMLGSIVGRTDRRQAMDQALQGDGVDTNSLLFSAGKLGGEIAGTLPVGGIVARGAAAVPGISALAPAIQSGGFNVGNAITNPLLRLGARAAGGFTTGVASAGLVNPADALTGGAIGAAIPVVGYGFSQGGKALGRGFMGPAAAPEVAQLADRAKQLGIDIPADRLVNSKPLNAVAAGLNYVPFSGRAATEEKMQTQLNQALSRTFGQNSDNVTMALRQAQGDLGSKFDTVLKSNTVAVDQQLMQDLGNVSAKAVAELEGGQAGIINRQIDEIVSKAGTGQIDGQAAYNIKKTLDRIGQRNSPEAYYARDLKKALMGALDRSLGPQPAAEFAKVRQQYGNMLDLESLAQNGVDGNVSIARIANMKGINNPDLQELADISAQFLKPREGQHGAAQRAVAGMVGFGVGGVKSLGAGIAAGRATNSLLNSEMARNAALGLPQNNALLQLAGNTNLGQIAVRTAPLLGTQ